MNFAVSLWMGWLITSLGHQGVSVSRRASMKDYLEG